MLQAKYSKKAPTGVFFGGRMLRLCPTKRLSLHYASSIINSYEQNSILFWS